MARNRDQGADIMFIKARFSELAAAAWRGYEKAGPGFLLICCENEAVFPANKSAFELKGSMAKGNLVVYYISGAAIAALGVDYPTASTEAMVDAYDAQREIVVIIEQQDAKGWSGYRYVGYLNPADLYAEMRDTFQLAETTLPATWTDAAQPVPGYSVLPQ